MVDCQSFMADLYVEPNLCYDKGASSAFLSFAERFQCVKRRDNRILQEGEYQRKDGRYRFRYLDEDSKAQICTAGGWIKMILCPREKARAFPERKEKPNCSWFVQSRRNQRWVARGFRTVGKACAFENGCPLFTAAGHRRQHFEKRGVWQAAHRYGTLVEGQSMADYIPSGWRQRGSLAAFDSMRSQTGIPDGWGWWPNLQLPVWFWVSASGVTWLRDERRHRRETGTGSSETN